MKDIDELKLIRSEVLQSNLGERSKKIVIALLSKEILETRSINRQIMDNIDFVQEDTDEESKRSGK